jgi:segregation and condensation protein A
MQMEEKTVPWWRKALSYALGGIRSGFGLFSRSAKSRVANEPEIAAGQEENPEEEATLTEHSPKLEPIADTVIEAEIAAVPEAAAAAEPEAEERLETASEPVPEEAAAEECLSRIESGREPAAEPEISDEPVDAPAVIPSAASAGEALPDRESVQQPPGEAEAPAEAAGEEETVTAPIEPAEGIAELEALPEAEVAAGPAAPIAMDEPAAAAEPVPEPASAPVELTEPAVEAAPEQVAWQSAAVAAESDREAAPAAEEAPEPASLPMDAIEPIPDQTNDPAKPDAAVELVPAAEATVSEPVPAREPAIAAVAEPVIEAVARPFHEPPQKPAPEPAIQVAPESEPAPEPAPAQPAPKPFVKLESRDNEADLSPFSVIVAQVYDGPLDLLLDLIRKQDIDIYDIPIARITAQFLAYVDQLKATDVDVAGDFIYTASLLIHIKSKMLLPRAPAGPDDAAEDPRRELVERLLEHERFKNAAQMLQQKQMLEAATWTNPGLREFREDESVEPEIAADTVDLVRIFRDILDRARNRPVIDVEEDSVTVGQMIQFLARRLTMEDKPVALRRLLSHTRSERALIAMFLALLELVRLQAILLRQDRHFSEIFIKKHVGFESVMNDGLANARDDWR